MRPSRPDPPGGTPSDPVPPEDDGAVELPIEEALDLHAFAPRDIPEVVADYLDEASRRGFQEVRIVHGKGIGVQRDRVRQVLAAHPAVESYRDAPAGRGHWGATLVSLRTPETSS